MKSSIKTKAYTITIGFEFDQVAMKGYEPLLSHWVLERKKCLRSLPRSMTLGRTAKEETFEKVRSRPCHRDDPVAAGDSAGLGEKARESVACAEDKGLAGGWSFWPMTSASSIASGGANGLLGNGCPGRSGRRFASRALCFRERSGGDSSEPFHGCRILLDAHLSLP